MEADLTPVAPGVPGGARDLAAARGTEHVGGPHMLGDRWLRPGDMDVTISNYFRSVLWVKASFLVQPVPMAWGSPAAGNTGQ